jgi:flagellar biosynthesis protein FlhF
MKVVPFLAATPAEALAQIHAQLGPEAVVLSVRPLPATGLTRLWKKNAGVEVLAGIEEAQEPTEPSPPSDTDLLNRLRSIRQGLGSAVERGNLQSYTPEPFAPEAFTPEPPTPSSLFPTASLPPRPDSVSAHSPPSGNTYTWRTVARLESQGLLPVFAERLQQRLYERHGAIPPPEAGGEWPMVQAGLQDFWRPAPTLMDGSQRPHVFIGPAGSGKTTLLCKWLACSVLLEEHTTRVWRLDSAYANTAEILNIYGEMFGVGIERFWHPPESPADLCLVDLPGVETEDAQGLASLEQALATLPSPRIHLVLNAAYDTPILFEQFRAFSRFKPEDLSFTHLDEEKRSAKLWNFVLGTNCSLRFLCAGQKIPGQFLAAEPNSLLPQHKHL